MSDDYVSRLRAELLRAGAVGERPRRRAHAARRLRPLAGVVVLALLVAAVVLIVPGSGRDETPAQHSATYRVRGADAERAAQILRERLKAAGIDGTVSVAGDTLTMNAPGVAAAALTAPGRFAIYDWEQSVLGPGGHPEPTRQAVTGGPNAGQEVALTEARARWRVERSPAGGRAVQAQAGWFALASDPAITNSDVAGASVDRTADRPTVKVDLTAHGQQAFRTLTRELARRGADQANLAEPLQSSQHLALVLDDRLVSVPYVNWREAPDGIDGADGAFLSDLATPEQARLDAALLSAGPLPGTLELIQG
jgi:preprotein translocase subunit SecD